MDNLSKEDRTKNMKAIRSVSSLEDRVSKALWRRGIRIRRNVNNLFGKPDFAIKKYKIVIFIDSCFWHSCELHKTNPKSNVSYWDQKLMRNKARDKEVNEYYESQGWHILRIWEHELKRKNFEETIDRICLFITQAKRDSSRTHTMSDRVSHL